MARTCQVRCAPWPCRLLENSLPYTHPESASYESERSSDHHLSFRGLRQLTIRREREESPHDALLTIMASTTSIPRFLLPQRGAIWRTRLPNSTLAIRHASSKAPGKKSSKPFILEQPKKFNPPSHGSRLPRQTPRYGGPPLSAEEKAAQKKKQYPNMMPPEGTFLHWFITNKSIHIWITMVYIQLSHFYI